MSSPSKKGMLAVVGTGIQAGRQLTREAAAWLKNADKILFCVSEPLTRDWILDFRPDAEDLSRFYEEGKDRRLTYEEMVQAILSPVRKGQIVCAAFYGHPGVFVSPSHDVVRRAKEEGYRAFMLPGISAEACLYADLGIDPAEHGCLSYEATEWLVFGHKLDPTCAVILWQVDCVGDATYCGDKCDGKHVPVLVEALLQYFPPDHIAYLYQAAVLPISRPKVCPIAIAHLGDAITSNASSGTLFIPPVRKPSFDMEVAKRLGMAEDELGTDAQMPPWTLDERLHIVG
jgi:hypothetical protein